MARDVAPVIRKLKTWRAANKLSQSKAVRALVEAGLPVKLRTLQQWEIASSAPHPVTAAALERFLDEQKSEMTAPPKTVAPVIERLTLWRKTNNLSQSLAVQVLLNAGLPAKLRTLQDWEIGRRSPTAITGAALERFLREHPKIDSPPSAG